MIYFCWVGEPQLQIYQGVFILSIAKAFFPLAEPVVVLRKTSPRLLTEGRACALCFAFCALRFAFCASHFVLCALCFARYSLFCIISMRLALVLLSSRRRAFSTASRVSSSIFWVDFITVRRFASLRLFISRMLLVWVSHITA